MSNDDSHSLGSCPLEQEGLHKGKCQPKGSRAGSVERSPRGNSGLNREVWLGGSWGRVPGEASCLFSGYRKD